MKRLTILESAEDQLLDLSKAFFFVCRGRGGSQANNRSGAKKKEDDGKGGKQVGGWRDVEGKVVFPNFALLDIA